MNSTTVSISIILSTYNESKNIINIIKSIERVLSNDSYEAEIVVVDDNSPDGTSKLVQEYANNNVNNYKIKLITRKNKCGLSSAIILGINESIGNIKIIMDSDFSHPPQLIPHIIKMITKYNFKLIIASRYMDGGFIKNWPFKRKLMSKIATWIAKNVLKIKLTDPMSGFFAFDYNILNNLKFEAIGYKLLLEILIKIESDVKIIEIPYTFIDRKSGNSKLTLYTILDFMKIIWKLYIYEKK